MSSIRTYIALDTSFSHSTIYFIRAKNVDQAIEVFCKGFKPSPKKYKNGKWRWGANYYSSCRELLSSIVDISFEIRRFKKLRKTRCEEVFAGIDWWELICNWSGKDFYMKSRKKQGRFYDWYSPEYDYYAIFPNPKFIVKKFKRNFSDAIKKL